MLEFSTLRFQFSRLHPEVKNNSDSFSVSSISIIGFCISIALRLGNTVSYSSLLFLFLLPDLSDPHGLAAIFDTHGHVSGARQKKAWSPWR